MDIAEARNSRMLASDAEDGEDVRLHSRNRRSSKRKRSPPLLESVEGDDGADSDRSPLLKSAEIDDGASSVSSLRAYFGTSEDESDDCTSKLEGSGPRVRPRCLRTYLEEDDIAVSSGAIGRRGPPITLANPSSDMDDISKILGCVFFALSSFNEKNQANQLPEYELVYGLSGCVNQLVPRIYHFNFIARPKNQSAKDNVLFFAEVRYAVREDGKVRPFCRCCCILGHPDIVTGLGGCELLCKTRPGRVQHPEDGFSKEPSSEWHP